MLFNEVFDKVNAFAKTINVPEHKNLAVQINLKGDDGGAFHVRVKDGKIVVEPTECPDKNCTITMTNDNFVKLMEGKLDPVKAYMFRKLKIEGDMNKALEFAKLLK